VACANRVASFPCADAFVVKVSSDGSKLLYATFLGGTQVDTGLAISVDQTGSAYVVGETLSSDFPVTAGAFQPIYGGTVGYGSAGGPSYGDGFAVRLDPAAHTLLYSTFLGGASADQATGIAVDANQNAFVVGTTRSRNFPVTPGAFNRHTAGTPAFYPSKAATRSSLNSAPPARRAIPVTSVARERKRAAPLRSEVTSYT
jgi:hypothetical protein